ncbi:MAG: hypothetical protein ACRDV9_05220 [Acidimicrobiia bacterium]
MRDLRLITPPAWFELDLEPSGRRASIDQMVAERTGSAVNPAFSTDLALLLERHAAEAYERGAVRASMFSQELGGEHVAAALMVLVVPGQVGTGGVADDRSADGGRTLAWGLAEALGPEGATEMRQLPAGPAVRVRRRLQSAIPDGEEVPVESVQYFVPFPDGDHLVLLNFSTPNLALADAFVEVFDAMAATLSWT